MKVLLFVICTAWLLSSCGEQQHKKASSGVDKIHTTQHLKQAPYNMTDEGDGTRFNYDSLPPVLIGTAQKALEQSSFQFPLETDFNKTIRDVFNIELPAYKNAIIALRPATFAEIAIRENKFILVQDAGADPPNFINSELLFHYNNYVFYKQKTAYAWLKANGPEFLRDLVLHYGYNKDKQLVQWVFDELDFSSLSVMDELLFANADSGKVLKRQLLDDIEAFIYKGPAEDFSYAKEGNGYNTFGSIIHAITGSPNLYAHPDEAIACLLNQQLRAGIMGEAEAYLIKHPKFVQIVKQNHYYQLDRLKEYIEQIYQRDTDN